MKPYKRSLQSRSGVCRANFPRRRPLDNTHCLACGRATGNLAPIYGARLPGCCADCVVAARATIERVLPALVRAYAPLGTKKGRAHGAPGRV